MNTLRAGMSMDRTYRTHSTQFSPTDRYYYSFDVYRKLISFIDVFPRGQEPAYWVKQNEILYTDIYILQFWYLSYCLHCLQRMHTTYSEDASPHCSLNYSESCYFTKRQDMPLLELFLLQSLIRLLLTRLCTAWFLKHLLKNLQLYWSEHNTYTVLRQQYTNKCTLYDQKHSILYVSRV